jgi:EAL domain-containing protein (putative c-di-GMP-specific phosphodiesterase class I)
MAMVQKNIELLKEDLREALYLDLDEFGLEAKEDEVISKFIGLWLHSAFQPIQDVRQTGEPLGHEALLRPGIGPESVSPVFAFEFADSQGRLIKLDRVARTLHMLNYLHLPANKGLLFLNVHPKLLVSVNAHGKVFERILHTHSVPTHQVVIEIPENAVENEKHLREAIDNYHDRGYRIAIDAFGVKHYNLERLWQISPDYVKLDLSVIREAETNQKVRRVLPKLIGIIEELGAQAIIEGIENETRYNIALDAGATLLQGYHLGRPASAGEWQKQKSGTAIRIAA